MSLQMLHSFTLDEATKVMISVEEGLLGFIPQHFSPQNEAAKTVWIVFELSNIFLRDSRKRTIEAVLLRRTIRQISKSSEIRGRSELSASNRDFG